MEHRPFCRCFSDSLMKDGNFRSHVSSGGCNCRNYWHDLKELLKAIRVQHRGIMFSQRFTVVHIRTDGCHHHASALPSSHGSLRTKGDAWRKTRQWWRDLVNQTQTFPPWAEQGRELMIPALKLHPKIPKGDQSRDRFKFKNIPLTKIIHHGKITTSQK